MNKIDSLAIYGNYIEYVDTVDRYGEIYDMAIKSNPVETTNETVETSKIELLKEVYYVDGSFYKTEAEAKMHQLKERLYDAYLVRQGYKGATKTSCMNQAKASKFATTLVYVDDVIKIIGESGFLK